MRKILFTLCTGLFCIVTACNHFSGGSDENSGNQKNLDANQMINKAFETGDANKLDSAVSKDFLDHTDHGDVKGIDSLKVMVNFIHTNMKDMKMEQQQVFSNGDYVISWMHYTGTSNGSMGMPKGPYDMHVMEVGKFKDGKCVEHWAYMDSQEMARMMASQMPQTNMKPDSTKTK